MQPVYTTGKVAKLCRVSPRTVAKWIDAGKLKSHRLPLSHDRRVEHADLITFAREHRFPLPGFDTAATPEPVDFSTRSMAESVANVKDFAAGREHHIGHLANDCGALVTTYETLMLMVNE
jgi:excisionase family DNA binding protein